MKLKDFVLLLLMAGICFEGIAQTPKTKIQKLPHAVFLQLIDSTDKFEIDHATQFKHIDLPQRYYNTFLSYIKDSVAAEVSGLKSIVYYNFTLKNGKIIIGDIYWSDTGNYIVFKIEDKKYVNYFTRDGVAQIKSVFKL